jgi:hypothetical protein
VEPVPVELVPVEPVFVEPAPVEPVLVEPVPAEAPTEALPVVVWQLPANCDAFTDAPACMTALNARAAAAAPRAPTIP